MQVQAANITFIHAWLSKFKPEWQLGITNKPKEILDCGQKINENLTRQIILKMYNVDISTLSANEVIYKILFLLLLTLK